MSIHLHFEESLGENLEDRFVGWQTDVEFALGSIVAETRSHATGDNNDSCFVFFDKLVADRDIGASINFAHVTLAVNMLRFDCIKSELLVVFSFFSLRLHDQISV